MSLKNKDLFGNVIEDDDQPDVQAADDGAQVPNAENGPAPSNRDRLNGLLEEEIPGYDPSDEEGAADMLYNYINGTREQRNKLADALYDDPRLAQMLADIINGKRGAAGAMTRYFGKDFLNAEEGSQEFYEIVAAEEERKKEQDAAEAGRKEYSDNLEATMPEVEAWCKENGRDVDEFLNGAWDRLISPILSGRYSREVCELIDHGLSYDKDTQDALAAGRVQGRNENINKMREERGDGMPKGITSAPPAEERRKRKRNSTIGAALSLQEDYQ